jgi:O-antigen/teichoic acid export membrane protein
VGHYALATGLTRHINAVLSPAPRVIFPAATEMHVKGDERGLERLYHDGTRMTMLVMLTVVLIAGFWANDFYRIWIGSKYLTGAPFHSVAVLFQILLLSVATSYSASIANQILVSAGRVRTVALALVCGSFLNLSISLLLIRSYGLVGVAIATVSASIIIDLVVMHVLVQRTLNLSLDTFLRRACARPLAAGLMQAALLGGVRTVMGRPENWAALFAQGAIAGLISALVVLAIGVTPEERRRFVFRPVRRVWRGTTEPVEATFS